MAKSDRDVSSQTTGPGMDATPTGNKTEAVEIPFKMLGEFRLLKRLGKGGMAEVYLAEQAALRRQVAVKVLRPEFIKEEQYVKRFRHEAAAAGSLNHPNIVQVYMVGEENGINYIAQEYVQGRNLKEYISRKGPMELKIALHILRQVASALQAASENGIVHRDIKPENVLLTNKGEAKVADFGLAQLTFQGERISLTQSGITLGTPLYMSPEQVNGVPLDSRSDIYSFGVMAWHMLAGRPPFTGETAMAVAVKHLNDKAPPLTDFRQDVPPAVCDLIERLMRKKKSERPADFATVQAELKRLIRQISGKEDSSTERTVIPQKRELFIDRPMSRQIGWLIGAAVLVLAASGGIGWSMRTKELSQIESTGALKATVLSSADAQLYYAITNPHDEAVWITLLNFNGVSDETVARAKTALGLIYLTTDRLKLAEKTFNDLSTESKYRINGLAGLAIHASLTGDQASARKYLGQIDDGAGSCFAEMDSALKDLRHRLTPNSGSAK